MALQSLEDILREYPFLTGLRSTDVATLAACASSRRYREGQYLTREGEVAAELFLLLEGQVALEAYVPGRGGLRLETLREGDVLGWSWLIEPYRWHFDSRALTPVGVVILDGACLRGLCEANHELGYELLLRFARLIEQRLHATRLQLLDVYQPEKKPLPNP